MGGLGNQMFQFAAGKALALRLGTECKVDVEFLNADSKGAYTQRKYELNVFDSNIEVADKKEIENALRSSLFSGILSKPKLYREKEHDFNEEILRLKDGTYLEGYWQSEKYFKQFEKEIRLAYKFKNEFIAGTEALLQRMKSSNSVSIHVRRGDYVTLPSASSFHGTCSPQYYKAALTQLNLKHKDIKAFVFSDDLDWCRTNLTLGDCEFVETGSAYKDMYLMQNCKHNIIANSSFSWWAAWLNMNSEKMVITPKKWFNDTTIKIKDIYPESWIKVE